MSSRFNPPNRDARSSLFSAYDDSSASRPSSQPSHSRPPAANEYPYNPRSSSPHPANGGGAFSAYPSGAGTGAPSSKQFRAATPNSRGQYSDAVLSELESQNDGQLEGMSAKVKMLKDITIAIGDEIRDSSALAEKMNDSFDSTRVRLRGTMNRMLLMAKRTGVGWKAWLGFLAAVVLLFWYVWLF